MKKMTDSIEVKVLFFGLLREKTGTARTELSLPQGSDLQQLRSVLEERFPTLKQISSLYRFAVNGEYTGNRNLNNGDEVALIPPVGGGKNFLTGEKLNPGAWISDEFPPEAGATVVFIGSVRNNFRGQAVSKLMYESYDSMAEARLSQIIDQAVAEFGLQGADIVHRVGEAKPGEPVLMVYARSSHRKEAFEACQWIVNEIKRDVPIWKKEFLKNGARWVSENDGKDLP